MSLGTLLLEQKGTRLEGMQMYTEALQMMDVIVDQKLASPEEVAEPMSELGMLLKHCDRCTGAQLAAGMLYHGVARFTTLPTLSSVT